MEPLSKMEDYCWAAGKQLRDERQTSSPASLTPTACGGGCIPLVPQTHSRNFTSSGPELIRSGSFLCEEPVLTCKRWRSFGLGGPSGSVCDARR
jgi:hypothetical protein